MEQLLQDFLATISPALQVLLQGVLVFLAGQVSIWLVKIYQTQKAKLGLEQQALLDIVVRKAVEAAEQIGISGEEKLTYAFDKVEKTLAGQGIVIDLDVIYSLIEAEVFNKNENEWSSLG